MNDFRQIIRSALEYYDEGMMKYYDTVRTFKYYSLIKNEGKIIFFNENKEKIYESKYDVIGKFMPNQNIWVWGWSSGELNKDLITTSRKVLNYALDLDKQNILLKTALITSRYQVTSNVQIDMHVALTAFLSKQSFIYRLDYFGELSPAEEEDVTDNIYKIHHKKGNPVSSYYIALINN